MGALQRPAEVFDLTAAAERRAPHPWLCINQLMTAQGGIKSPSNALSAEYLPAKVYVVKPTTLYTVKGLLWVEKAS